MAGRRNARAVSIFSTTGDRAPARNRIVPSARRRIIGAWRRRSISRPGWISKMWRDAVRWLFVRLRLVRRPDLGVGSWPASDTRGATRGQVGDGPGRNRNKWACLRCPGRCGRNFNWPCRRTDTPVGASVSTGSDGLASHRRFASSTIAVPLLDYGGTVHWCADSGQHQPDSTP